MARAKKQGEETTAVVTEPQPEAIQEEKRGVGRPRLKDHEKRRAGMIRLAGPIVTPDERKMIDWAASLAGQSLTEWCRETLVSTARQVVAVEGAAVVEKAKEGQK